MKRNKLAKRNQLEGGWLEELDTGIGHYFEIGEIWSLCRENSFELTFNRPIPRFKCSKCERRLAEPSIQKIEKKKKQRKRQYLV